MQVTSFVSQDTESRFASNNGLDETSGFISDTSGIIVKGGSMKQLSARPLNSISQGQTWQHSCMDTRHVKMLQIYVKSIQFLSSYIKLISAPAE